MLGHPVRGRENADTVHSFWTGSEAGNGSTLNLGHFGWANPQYCGRGHRPRVLPFPMLNPVQSLCTVSALSQPLAELHPKQLCKVNFHCTNSWDHIRRHFCMCCPLGYPIKCVLQEDMFPGGNIVFFGTESHFSCRPSL